MLPSQPGRIDSRSVRLSCLVFRLAPGQLPCRLVFCRVKLLLFSLSLMRLCSLPPSCEDPWFSLVLKHQFMFGQFDQQASESQLTRRACSHAGAGTEREPDRDPRELKFCKLSQLRMISACFTTTTLNSCHCLTAQEPDTYDPGRSGLSIKGVAPGQCVCPAEPTAAIC